jgi:Fibronectin type III domain
MKTIHVSLGFAQLTDAQLADFAVAVINGLTNNAATFASPPVAPADLGTATSTFQDALAAAAGGGVAQTAAKDVARDALLNLLRQEANYVQGVANGDEPTILSSGFQLAAAGHSPQSPLAKPVIAKIINEASGQLLVRVKPQANAHAYEVQTSTGTGAWQAAGTFTQARRIVIPDLTPGTTYNVHVRAIGGSTGYSDWSDPVSHMAM